MRFEALSDKTACVHSGQESRVWQLRTVAYLWSKKWGDHSGSVTVKPGREAPPLRPGGPGYYPGKFYIQNAEFLGISACVFNIHITHVNLGLRYKLCFLTYAHWPLLYSC